MDKTGKILWELTIMMKFFPLLLIIVFVWLFFKIRAGQAARRLNQPILCKEIKKGIACNGFPKISFIPSICAMGLSVVYYLIGSIILVAGGIWAIVINEGDKNSDLFNKFCNFGFNYWYLVVIFGVIFAIGFIIFFVRGIYVNVVFRKKIKEL